MTVSMIVAKGKNNEIGADNDLLWHLPSDLKFFKEKTMGKSIIMGRKTFLSLPRALPGRKNIVLTHDESFSAEGAFIAKNAEEALLQSDTDEVFIIGGASVYEEFFPMSQKLYITEVEFESDVADVFFPDIDLSCWDREVLDTGEENGLSFRHVLYRKIRNSN